MEQFLNQCYVQVLLPILIIFQLKNILFDLCTNCFCTSVFEVKSRIYDKKTIYILYAILVVFKFKKCDWLQKYFCQMIL